MAAGELVTPIPESSVPDLLKANKAFVRSYRQAHERRRAGSVDVEFPYGTYQLRTLKLVRCQQGPPLQ